jgi:hypothetical protein
LPNHALVVLGLVSGVGMGVGPLLVISAGTGGGGKTSTMDGTLRLVVAS